MLFKKIWEWLVMAALTINGKKYWSNNVKVTEKHIKLDSDTIPIKELTGPEINIIVEGQINSAETVKGNITVLNNVLYSVKTQDGNVSVGGSVSGDIRTVNGNITINNEAGCSSLQDASNPKSKVTTKTIATVNGNVSINQPPI